MVSEVQDGARGLSVLAWPFSANRAENPYNHLLYGDVVRRRLAEVSEFSLRKLFVRRYDIVHVHWPDGFWPRHTSVVSSCFAAALCAGIAVSKLRGARVVWTTHNLAAHERRGNDALRRAYMRLFLRTVDGVIHMNDENMRAVRERYPEVAGKKYTVIGHGFYDDFYGEPRVSREVFLRGLSLDRRFVFLFMGQLRRYKRVHLLCKAFNALDDSVRNECGLIIAGRCDDPAYRAEIEAEIAGSESIRFSPDFVPDADVPVLLASSDVMVLPYGDMQNSGAAYLAMTYGLRVLAPALPGFQSLAREFPALVSLYADSISKNDLAAAVRSRAGPAKAAISHQELREAIGDATARFYRELVDTRVR